MMMIDDLVLRAAQRTGLSEDQTRLGLKSALGLIQKHGDADKVSALFDAIPGASTLAAAGLQAISDSKRGGLMAAMMRGTGGEAGAAMSDAMTAGQTLARAGVTTSDMQSILPMAREFVREKTGEDLLSDVLASLPGIGKLLLG